MSNHVLSRVVYFDDGFCDYCNHSYHMLTSLLNNMPSKLPSEVLPKYHYAYNRTSYHQLLNQPEARKSFVLPILLRDQMYAGLPFEVLSST